MATSFETVILPAPETVYQQAEFTCWAACYRSLLQTSGGRLSFTESQLAELFNGHYSSTSGLTVRGGYIEAHLAGMTTAAVGAGAHLNLQRIAEALAFGYVLLTYILPESTTRQGHMVVAFGVEQNGIYVMNPHPRGNIFLTVEYLRKSPSIWFARPIFPTMSSNVFQGIR